MLRFFSLAVCVILSSLASGQELPLAFNGQDLTGWKVPKDNIWWTVDDGVLRCSSGPKHKGMHLFTEREYENFIIQLEYKNVSGTIDSGVYIRGDHDQIQIGISGSLKRDMTASPYIPGKGYPVEATGVVDLLKPDDWNKLTLIAMGRNYVVWLNGQQVVNYQSDTAKEKGPIGLQLHKGREMAIDFRNIRIAELD